MSLYVKLETRILTDSKIVAAGPDGFTLWAKGLCYSKEHLTDGFIPSDALAILGIGMRNVNATVRKLCVVGLWSVCENGFTVGADNWADHQTTKAEVNANRESAKLRKRRSRAGHTVTQDDVTDESQGCHANVTQPEPEHRVQSQSTKPEPEHNSVMERDKRDVTHRDNNNNNHGNSHGGEPPPAEEKPHSKRFTAPSIEEVITYGKEIDLPESECKAFWFYYDSKDWKRGKERIQKWRSALSGWKTRWESNPQKARTYDDNWTPMSIAAEIFGE